MRTDYPTPFLEEPPDFPLPPRPSSLSACRYSLDSARCTPTPPHRYPEPPAHPHPRAVILPAAPAPDRLPTQN